MQDFYVFKSGYNVRGFYQTEDGGFGVVGEMLESVQSFLKHSHFKDINLVNGVPDIADFFPEPEEFRIRDVLSLSPEQKPYNPTKFLEGYVEGAVPLPEWDYLACIEVIGPKEDSNAEKLSIKDNLVDGLEGIIAIVISAGRRTKDLAATIPVFNRT